MRTEQEFRDIGHIILGEFEFEESKYIFYRNGLYDPTVFITGDKFEWVFGLEYIPSIKHVIEVRFISDELRREIEGNIPSKEKIEEIVRDIIKQNEKSNT